MCGLLTDDIKMMLMMLILESNEFVKSDFVRMNVVRL